MMAKQTIRQRVIKILAAAVIDEKYTTNCDEPAFHSSQQISKNAKKIVIEKLPCYVLTGMDREFGRICQLAFPLPADCKHEDYDGPNDEYTAKIVAILKKHKLFDLVIADDMMTESAGGHEGDLCMMFFHYKKVPKAVKELLK